VKQASTQKLTEERPLRVELENRRSGEESREWYCKWNVTITNNIQTKELPGIYTGLYTVAEQKFQ
jgi:hypothetical protein